MPQVSREGEELQRKAVKIGVGCWGGEQESAQRGGKA